jgi:neutral ceramidase
LGVPIRRFALPVLVAAAIAAAPVPASAATSSTLRAGAGQADVTPPQTGYFLGGWTRADRLALGQSTRLYANALVLQRGTTKLALVAVELFAIPAGFQEDVAKLVSDLGYTRESILMAASHTHSGPGGFANNPTYNTAAPSPETIGNPASFPAFLNPAPADPQLYTFLVKQVAASIRRADSDRAPAAAGWAQTRLTGLTQNRSIEAHLADHGIHVATGSGTAAMDPLGVDDTIDPSVDVLRVDKLVTSAHRPHRTVHVPIGAYSNFADHGTVVKSENQVYSGDHHAAAWRVFVDDVRKAAKVPSRQTIVNVYPNGAEGDQTAGLQHTGIAGARMVGGVEAGKMFDAWKLAGKHLSRRPVLDVRWTRTCFCGRSTATGPVAAKGVEGIGFLTGSEEGRGPLYDLTHVSFEGRKNPLVDPVQGDKIAVAGAGNPAPAVPVSLTRVGNGVLIGVPGEPTKEVGVRLRAAALAPLKGAGVTHAIVAGLADEYIQYITTPEEYGEQSYEGASTLFGRNQATFLQERYAELATAMASGKPAAAPYPLDVSYGVKPDGPAYPAGAATGTLTRQPTAASVKTGDDVKITWTGGPNGHDRPVDRAFVSAQRLVRHRWQTVDTDLGLYMLWHVDSKGAHDATWTVPGFAPSGTYRLRVTATRYELLTNTFQVTGG